ncbi:GNAT family N-acetyltransferase [Arthrobacter sp. UM1]|uniref:GNAT family N-acetyltransferase n=1 Tax=Arthrobacter sp. UM1 TaxID=2766776 RepID=UPI001CF6F63E|nr:GNAT family protein [Arthrobacter sp. UM1]MCB4208862.1 GNAT family N-acetyltransferase [Arthrobacter sp. UM1]
MASKWFGPTSRGAFLTNDIRENVQAGQLLAKSQAGGLLLFCDENDVPFGLGTFTPKGNPRNYEVAVIIGEESLWETGRGALASSLLVDHLFLTLDAHRVFAMTLAVNPHAISTLSTGGFLLEARLRDHYFVDGRFEDCLVWSQLREEYDKTVEACHPESAFVTAPSISPEMRTRAERLLLRIAEDCAS